MFRSTKKRLYAESKDIARCPFLFGGIMAFRVVLIENEIDIKLKLDNLVMNTPDGELWIPIDDISMIVLDNLHIRLTTRMLSMLAKYNIGMIICDTSHLPIGFYSSYDNHSRMSKKIGFQIEKEELFYDQLWCEIINHKIYNQSKVLELLGKTKEKIEQLDVFRNEIEIADRTNREAHAAKVYFNELMGASFSRGNDELIINSGLDYGYTILRSYIARVLVGYGMNSELGIHHRSEYNRFNLVDDLIEPFRPIVDLFVYRLLDGEKYFKIEHRRALVNILNHKIKFNNKKMFLSNAIEEYVYRFASIVENKPVKMIYPNVECYLGEEDEV